MTRPDVHDDDIPEPAEWDSRPPDLTYQTLRALALVVLILAVILLVVRFG